MIDRSCLIRPTMAHELREGIRGATGQGKAFQGPRGPEGYPILTARTILTPVLALPG